VGDHTSSGRTLGSLKGAASARFIDDSLRDALRAGQESIGEAVEPRMCAGWDYADLLTGRTDYLLFSRTHAWDHAPGAAIVREAGFAVRRIDGSEYLPGVPARSTRRTPTDRTR